MLNRTTRVKLPPKNACIVRIFSAHYAQINADILCVSLANVGFPDCKYFCKICLLVVMNGLKYDGDVLMYKQIIFYIVIDAEGCDKTKRKCGMLYIVCVVDSLNVLLFIIYIYVI